MGLSIICESYSAQQNTFQEKYGVNDREKFIEWYEDQFDVKYEVTPGVFEEMIDTYVIYLRLTKEMEEVRALIKDAQNYEEENLDDLALGDINKTKILIEKWKNAKNRFIDIGDYYDEDFVTRRYKLNNEFIHDFQQLRLDLTNILEVSFVSNHHDITWDAYQFESMYLFD